MDVLIFAIRAQGTEVADHDSVSHPQTDINCKEIIIPDISDISENKYGLIAG
jgi:hypothetical protein